MLQDICRSYYHSRECGFTKRSVVGILLVDLFSNFLSDSDVDFCVFGDRNL